jgi:hypothetical protein
MGQVFNVLKEAELHLRLAGAARRKRLSADGDYKVIRAMNDVHRFVHTTCGSYLSGVIELRGPSWTGGGH